MIREMLINDILKLPSVDSWNKAGPPKYTALDVLEFLVKAEVSDSPFYYDLRDSMVAGDYSPIHIFNSATTDETYGWKELEEDTLYMGNGHHRLGIAFFLLGWTHIKVTDNWAETEGWR